MGDEIFGTPGNPVTTMEGVINAFLSLPTVFDHPPQKVGRETQGPNLVKRGKGRKRVIK